MSGHHKWADITKDKWDIARERDELREILAPLLEGDGLPRYIEDCCQFCASTRPERAHDLDCPVLRADELLGRHGASRQATRRATS